MTRDTLYGLWLMRKLSIFLWTSVLVGCAGPQVAARVTTFQQWPTYVGTQYYTFVPADPSQNNNLEYQSFQDMVRAGIGATGLVEARSDRPARFNISFKYGVTPTQVIIRRFYDPYPYYYSYDGAARGFMWDRMDTLDWQDEPVLAYRNALTIFIRDNEQAGKEVYRATAYSLAGQDKLFHIMPYLVRAIFDGFPGNNGSERELKYADEK